MRSSHYFDLSSLQGFSAECMLKFKDFFSFCCMKHQSKRPSMVTGEKSLWQVGQGVGRSRASFPFLYFVFPLTNTTVVWYIPSPTHADHATTPPLNPSSPSRHRRRHGRAPPNPPRGLRQLPAPPSAQPPLRLPGTDGSSHCHLPVPVLRFLIRPSCLTVYFPAASVELSDGGRGGRAQGRARGGQGAAQGHLLPSHPGML
jgi:hypothetical protein